MARAWEAQGSYNSATEVYLRIVKRYRGSGEAHDAFENLLGMASMYEQQGRYHLAMALFDEVEALM
jgi:TolA-binding protein